MPSRKRNKGKERKAKKAELVKSERTVIRGRWQRWAHGEDDTGLNFAQLSGRITCNHGYDLVLPPDNHPVCCFMDDFLISRNNGKPLVSNLKDTFQSQPQVWKNGSYRNMAINILVRIGTHFIDLLNLETIESMEDIKDLGAVISIAILVLENYDGTDNIVSTINGRVVASKLRDIHWSGSSLERDMLKFFRKRTACSCLKDMHLEARKTQPKVGMCNHCWVMKERSLLMVCSRCRVAQYCSRECQIAQWPKHKCECDVFVKAQNQQSK